MLVIKVLPLLLLVALSPPSVAGKNFTEMIVFGDSLSDIGNLRAIRPDLVPLPSGRQCNGFLSVDYVAAGLGLPLQPSLHLPPPGQTSFLPPQGTNYACVLALSQLIGNNQVDLLSLPSQVGAFLTHTPPPIPATALFVLFIGSNDVFVARDLIETAFPLLGEEEEPKSTGKKSKSDKSEGKKSKSDAVEPKKSKSASKAGKKYLRELKKGGGSERYDEIVGPLIAEAEVFLAAGVASLINQIELLISVGAKEIFVVNAVDIGITPGTNIRAQGFLDRAETRDQKKLGEEIPGIITDLTRYWNSQLEPAILALKAQFAAAGVTFYEFDLFSFFANQFENGFEVVDEPCWFLFTGEPDPVTGIPPVNDECPADFATGNLDAHGFLFWDEIHGTTEVNRRASEAILPTLIGA